MTLAESVQAMSAAFASSSSTSAATEAAAVSTPRPQRAFKVIHKEEGLSPRSLAAVPRIFRNNPELADEYLNFPPSEPEARSFWLYAELERITRN